jgi:prepilin-type N-terminal cleavage/methylation domain-containing protein
MRAQWSEVRGQRSAGERGSAARGAGAGMHRVASGMKGRVGFTLIELLTVVAIIAVITAIAVPAIRTLGKSNDQSQAANMVRALLAEARSIAVSQHRMAGVVFFGETAGGGTTAVHGNAMAAALYVQLFDQSSMTAGRTGFWYYGSMRQYLPEGVQVAALSDLTGEGNVAMDNPSGGKSLIIMFDPTGSLALRSDIYAKTPTGAEPGPYSSYPGIFLFSKAEYDSQPAANRLAWLKRNSTAIIVNPNTGGLLR